MDTTSLTVNGTASGHVRPTKSESQLKTFVDPLQSQILGGAIVSPEDRDPISFNRRVVHLSPQPLTSEESNDEYNKATTINPNLETPSEFSETTGSQSEPREDEHRESSVNFKDQLSDGQNSSIDDRRIRRQIANCNERRRMQSINAGFQALRQFLPQRCGEKLSKAAILQQTAELIQTMKLERQQSANESPDVERPPQSKRRRIDDPADKSTAAVEHLRIIEGLRLALQREQQLRLLYERKFTELKISVLNNLNAAASSISDISARNGSQLIGSPLLGSQSVESPIVKATLHELPTTALSTPLHNIVTDATHFYNNAMLNAAAHQQQTGPLSSLLTGIPMTPEARVANPIPLSPLQISNSFSGGLPMSALTCSTVGLPTGPLTPHASPSRTHLVAILDAIHQMESENAKKFANEGLGADVLVR